MDPNYVYMLINKIKIIKFSIYPGRRIFPSRWSVIPLNLHLLPSNVALKLISKQTLLQKQIKKKKNQQQLFDP